MDRWRRLEERQRSLAQHEHLPHWERGGKVLAGRRRRAAHLIELVLPAAGREVAARRLHPVDHRLHVQPEPHRNDLDQRLHRKSPETTVGGRASNTGRSALPGLLSGPTDSRGDWGQHD